MRPNIISAITLLMAFAAVSCVDDDIYDSIGDKPTSSSLQFDVNAFTVVDGTSRSAEPSPNPEPESAAEKNIRDFWLFQFRPDGTQLAAPVYYSIPDDGATLDELTSNAYTALVKNTLMTIYVVTNTGNSTWATGSDFDTLDKVKEQTLPSPFPIQAGVDENNDGVADDFYIPMSGQAENVKAEEGGLIVVPVTRMYAKIKVQANLPGMNFYYANITSIPWYCKMTSIAKDIADNGEPAAVPFPDGTRMISRAFNSKEVITDDEGNKWLILYMPENIRGEIDDANKANKTNIPENTLTVDIRSKYAGMDYYYTVYPGENDVNNFNIRRNCVYRVNIDVRNITDQHNPSSNCFIVKPGEMLSFEPYNRVEKGGGYDIADYLNPYDEDKAIDHLEIIWQTKDCIGDNTDGKLVHFELNNENPINSKIIIDKTGIEGNALIGAYNKKNVIVWSWHIWVTPNEPDNLANAVIYTTYRWDNTGIHNNEPRIPGYSIMQCNLGALAFRSEDDMKDLVRTGWDGWKPVYENLPAYSLKKETEFPESQRKTFGMMYQWGRKDPFPPMTYSTGTEDANGTLDYLNKYTDTHYANDNITVVSKSDTEDGSELFHSTNTADVLFSIQNPTVYIMGSTVTSNSGNWCSPNDNKLWGGLDPNDVSKNLTKLNVGDNINIYNNYGEKSIFDPCPKGWRVPPGDLWLGFTSTGYNPTNFSEVNQCIDENGHRPGLSMYVQRWQSGPTIYFPMQGTRAENGRFKNTGLCGNYHNATCVSNTRVNILHMHRDMSEVATSYSNKQLMLFKVFETIDGYVSKSTASPVRCVRDSR